MTSVLLGTAGAQLIGLISLPFLSRLFAPEAFGVFQVFTAIMMGSVMVASLRYEFAYINAETDEEADAALVLCLIINVCIAAAAGLVCSFLAPRLPVGLPVLVPIGVLIAGVFQTLGYVPVREQKYGPAAMSKVIQSGGFAVGGTALGLLGAPILGLVIAGIFGRLAGAASILARLGVRRVRRDLIWDVAIKHRAYPLFSAPGAVVNVTGLILTPMIFYAAFGSTWAGQLGLIERACAAPVGMIAVSLSQVYAGRLASMIRNKERGASPLFWKLVGVLSLIGLIPAVAMAMFGAWAIPWVFGPEWVEAGMIAKVMAPLLLVSFVVAPINATLVVAKRPKTQLAWEVGRLVLMGAVWAVVVQFGWSPIEALSLYVAAACASYAVFVILAARALSEAAPRVEVRSPLPPPAGAVGGTA